MQNKTYNFRYDKCFLIGDTHSLSVLYEAISTRIPDNCDCVFMGDGGEGFGDKDLAIPNTLNYFKLINELCQKQNINLYLIRGNHSATYSEIWESEWSNIFLIKDVAYGIFPNGKKVLFIGGGISVDRCVRKENQTYWKDERTPFIPDLEKCDIMFSHDTADHFNHPTNTLSVHFGWYVDRDVALLNDCLAQRNVMKDIIDRSEVKTIFSGHYHNSVKEERYGVYYQCVAICEIVEFDSNYEYKL